MHPLRRPSSRAAVFLLLVCLSLGSLADQAEAKRTKPVATTLFAHGPSQFGEIDGVQWFTELFPDSTPLRLDTDEPTGSPPKSMTYSSPYINSQCSGSPLAYPTFKGDLAGTIKGDIKLVAHFLGAPGTVTFRLWTDTPVFACNADYWHPEIEVEAELPAGQSEVEIELPNKTLEVETDIMIMVLAPDVGYGYEGQVGRILYDSSDTPTRLEFACVPASGRSCTRTSPTRASSI